MQVASADPVRIFLCLPARSSNMTCEIVEGDESVHKLQQLLVKRGLAAEPHANAPIIAKRTDSTTIYGAAIRRAMSVHEVKAVMEAALVRAACLPVQRTHRAHGWACLSIRARLVMLPEGGGGYLMCQWHVCQQQRSLWAARPVTLST
jgi:hypothetical protein